MMLKLDFTNLSRKILAEKEIESLLNRLLDHNLYKLQCTFKHLETQATRYFFDFSYFLYCKFLVYKTSPKSNIVI